VYDTVYPVIHLGRLQHLCGATLAVEVLIQLW